MRIKIAIVTMLLSCLFCASLSADQITGTFTMSGLITVTANTMTWESDAPGNAPNLFTFNDGAGSFALFPNGSQQAIANLTNPPEVVGSVFPEEPFVSFPASPLFPGLNINYIFAGIFSDALCSAGPAVGQTCSLSGSPFNFVNNAGADGAPIQATATFAFSGVTSDHLGVWTANFTSAFNVPYQTVLTQVLGAPGFVTSSYSAKVTVSPVPESGLLLFGGMLAACGITLRRRTV